MLELRTVAARQLNTIPFMDCAIATTGMRKNSMEGVTAAMTGGEEVGSFREEADIQGKCRK